MRAKHHDFACACFPFEEDQGVTGWMAALGHYPEHATIVHRSPEWLKATVLAICFIVLAWFLRAILKRP